MNATMTDQEPRLGAAGLDQDEADRTAFLELAARMIASANGGRRAEAWNIISAAASPRLNYQDRIHAAQSLGNALLTLDELETDPAAVLDWPSEGEIDAAKEQHGTDRDEALALLLRGSRLDPAGRA